MNRAGMVQVKLRNNRGTFLYSGLNKPAKIYVFFLLALPVIHCAIKVNKIAEDEGLEPTRALARRFSRPLPYQLGLILRYIELLTLNYY